MVGAIQRANVFTTMHDSAHQQLTPASQRFEDLACAYWGSDTLFAALELNLFGCLGEETLPLPVLATLSHCHPALLARLLPALARLNLVEEKEAGWRNLPETIQHLVPGKPDYMGDFLLYRRYLQPTWHRLAEMIASRPLPPALDRNDDYPTRNRHYVRALDQLARLKAKEITTELSSIPWHGPVLDVGGGAGALSRALIQNFRQQAAHATLFDLAEVLAAAQELYPRHEDWHDIALQPGEFLSHTFPETEQFGLLMFSNFLHIYNESDTKNCLTKASTLISADGYVLIHDYCPDRATIKGPLYDINMLINTPNGQCHNACSLISWLAAVGLSKSLVVDLASDSTLILARRPPC